MANATHRLTALGWERAYPWALGLLAFMLAVWAGWMGLSPSRSSGYLGAAVSLGGVFAGFMATIKALLFSMDGVVFRRLKSSGYIHDLVRYVSEALWGSLLLCGVGISGFFTPPHWWMIDALLLGVAVFALSAIHRVTRISTALLLTH